MDLKIGMLLMRFDDQWFECFEWCLAIVLTPGLVHQAKSAQATRADQMKGGAQHNSALIAAKQITRKKCVNCTKA